LLPLTLAKRAELTPLAIVSSSSSSSSCSIPFLSKTHKIDYDDDDDEKRRAW